MLPKTYFTTMARYNRWMNERIYDCCAGLSDEERKKDRGAFFKSIHGTLNHILLGDLVWFGRFKSEPFPGFSGLADELYADFEALREARVRTDAEILEFVDAQDKSRIAGELRYTTVVNPAPPRFTVLVRADALFQPPDPPPRPGDDAGFSGGSRPRHHRSHLVAGRAVRAEAGVSFRACNAKAHWIASQSAVS